MDTLHFNFTVARLNKYNNNNNKKMEKFGYIAKCQNYLNDYLRFQQLSE